MPKPRTAHNQGPTDQAWEKLFTLYPIEEHTIDGGVYTIQAKDIKQFREPRLMTKFDTSAQVAAPLRNRGLNVLPISRSAYTIGAFNLYETFPDVTGLTPVRVELPAYETLRVDSLTSESNAINALIATHALEHFLGENNQGFIETFNGRMGSGAFTFTINQTKNLTPVSVSVDHAQLEIDGGFESNSSISIMEAKNIRHNDFNIRQLYYPYRKYLNLVKKPIRLVFSQYTNLTYYLYEYTFDNPDYYSSIRLLNTGAYTLDTSHISIDELQQLLHATPATISDDRSIPLPNGKDKIAFPQADRFDRIIALIEHINTTDEKTMSKDAVTDFMGLTERQTYYYSAAAEYLGLVTRNTKTITLSPDAIRILTLGYKQRQLAYVKQMIKHDIFHILTTHTMTTGQVPHKTHIIRVMQELNVCDNDNTVSTLKRRARTVNAWLTWILNLTTQ